MKKLIILLVFLSIPLLAQEKYIKGALKVDTLIVLDSNNIEPDLQQDIANVENVNSLQQMDIEALYDSIFALRSLINSFMPIISSLPSPTLTSATADGDSSLIVLILSSNASADSTIIQRTVDLITWTNIDTVNEDVASYWDVTTHQNTKYYYRCFSYNESATSGYSDIKNATTIVIDAAYVIYMPAGKETVGDSLGSLTELQTMINNGQVLAGTQIKFEKGGTWTTRGNAGASAPGLNLVGLQGTLADTIVFTTYGIGNKPRFDFTGFGDVFQLKDQDSGTAKSARYIRFEGLSIFPSGTYSNYNLPRYAFGCGSGQDIAGISDIEVRNCYIKNVGGGINLQSDGADIFNIVLVQDTIIETFGGTYFTGYDGMGCAVSFQAADGYRDYDIRIDSCHFENIPNHANAGVHDHAIYTHNNSREYLIRYNTVKDTSPSDTLNTDGFAIAGGAQMTISNNTFDGEIFVGIGLSAQQKNSGTQDSIDVYNNVIGNGVVYGIKIYQLSAYTGTILNYLNIYNNKIYDIDEAALCFENRAKLTNSLIANNTIVDWTSSAVTFYAFPASGSTGNYFYNNIFTNATNTAPYYRGANVRTIDIDDIFAGLDYNVYYRISGTSFWKRYDVSWNYLDEITSFATWKSETNKDANSISGSNPLFVDIGAYDLHLQSGSPAKDVGTTVSKVTTDFEGDSRPYNTVYDIGYDEYEP